MTTPQRWEPDTNLVAAVLSVPRTTFKLTDLNWHDRCWLVAGLGKEVLGEAGLTAQEIADRTHCSLRLVRDIRAEELTQGFVVAHKLNAALTSELSSERSAHSSTRSDLAQRSAAAEMWRNKFDQLIGAVSQAKTAGEKIAECYRGHALVGDNVYRHRGRSYCRQCNRENTIAYRRKRKSQPSDQQCHSGRVSQRMHPESLASPA